MESNHLKKITAKAKQIRKANPLMKWTDAVKKASLLLGYTKNKTSTIKTVVKNPKLQVYAKPNKAGKLKVYARPVVSRVKKTKGTRAPIDSMMPKGVGAINTIAKFINFAESKKFQWYGASSKDFVAFLKKYPKPLFGVSSLAKIDYYDLYELNPQITDWIATAKIDTNTMERAWKIGGTLVKTKSNKPMLGLSNYPQRSEKIFLGTTTMTCTKMRNVFCKKPKNVGELEKIYSVPEVKVQLIGRKAVKGTVKITSSYTSAELIRTIISDKYPNLLPTRELFGVVYLNQQNRIIGLYVDGIGGQVSVAVDLKYVLVVGLKLTSQSVIIFHNHPSGEMLPSEQDKQLTRNLKEGFETLNIKLIDHIILSGVDEDYFSFNNSGLL
jgi:DNA repair protein RadC